MVVTQRKRKYTRRRPSPGRVLIDSVAFQVALARNSMKASHIADKLGIPKATLSMWYTGRNRVPIRKLTQIARLLGIPVKNLISDKDRILMSAGPDEVEQITIDGKIERVIIPPGGDEG